MSNVNSAIVPTLRLSDLTDRAFDLYCILGDFLYDDGTVGGYAVAAAGCQCVGIATEFEAHYGPASEWSGTGIDFGELIHWANSLG